MAEPILFYDILNPHCRSVMIFTREMNIHLKEVQVSMNKCDNKDKDFIKLSPVGHLPLYKEGNFVLLKLQLSLVIYVLSII